MTGNIEKLIAVFLFANNLLEFELSVLIIIPTKIVPQKSDRARNG